MTINDLAASYLEMHASRLRTGNQFKRRFERDIIPVIGNVRWHNSIVVTQPACSMPLPDVVRLLGRCERLKISAQCCVGG